MRLIDADKLVEKLESVVNSGSIGITRYEDWPYISYGYLRQMIDEASAIEWTSMESRPPKYEGFYLCHYLDRWDDGEDVATMYFNGKDFGIPGLTDNGIKVLHWMPALWPGTDGEVAIHMSKEQFRKTFDGKKDET